MNKADQATPEAMKRRRKHAAPISDHHQTHLNNYNLELDNRTK